MARELNRDFTHKPKKEFILSQEEWGSVQKEMADLHFQIKKAQTGMILLQSKIVKIFDTIKNQLDAINKQTVEQESNYKNQLEKLRQQVLDNEEQRDQMLSSRVQDLMDQYHQMSKKYSHQVKDLCQSITHQSEQVWSLSDQVQEIKEELSHSPSS